MESDLGTTTDGWGILGQGQPGHCCLLPQENHNAISLRRKDVALLLQQGIEVVVATSNKAA
jgi:hypothetical protein